MNVEEKKKTVSQGNLLCLFLKNKKKAKKKKTLKNCLIWISLFLTILRMCNLFTLFHKQEMNTIWNLLSLTTTNKRIIFIFVV